MKEGSYTFKSFLYKKSFYVCLFGMDGNSAVVQCFDEKRWVYKKLVPIT